MTRADPLIARLDALAADLAESSAWFTLDGPTDPAEARSRFYHRRDMGVAFGDALVTAWPEIRTRLEAASPQALAEYEARRDKGLAVIRAEKAERERDAALADVARMRAALGLIAAPKRPDGTYNRGREACEQIARAALKGETT